MDLPQGDATIQVFMSYRREDCADVSRRIYDRLATSFCDDAIFKDVDNTLFFVSSKTYLSDMLQKYDVGELNQLRSIRRCSCGLC